MKKSSTNERSAAVKVHVGGAKPLAAEEDDIISEDLSETYHAGSIVLGTSSKKLSSSRHIKNKLREKTTKNRKKRKIKYHIRSPEILSDMEQEDVVIGSTSRFDEPNSVTEIRPSPKGNSNKRRQLSRVFSAQTIDLPKYQKGSTMTLNVEA